MEARRMVDAGEGSSEVSDRSISTPLWRHPLWLVVLVGVVLRLYHLGWYSIWYDETITLWGRLFVDKELTFLTTSESRLIPMFAVMTKIWYATGEHLLGLRVGSPASDAFLRFMPAVFSILLIPAVYHFSMYLFRNRTGALVAAWFVAISPFQIYYAQEYRPHTLYALLVTLGMYFSARALEEGGRKNWIGVVVVGVLSFYTYYFAAFYLVSMNLFALSCFTRYRSKIVPWSISQITIFILIIPTVLMALQVWGMHTNAEEHWFPHPTLKTGLLTLKVMFAGYSPNIPLYWTMFFLGCGILAAGVFSLRGQWRVFSLLVCMSAVPILLQIGLWATQDFAFYTYRIQLAYIPAVYILMGAGVVWIRLRGLRASLVVLFSVLTVPALGDYYQQNIHPVWTHVIGARYKVDSRSASELIRAGLQEGDTVAHAATFSLSPFRDHYLSEAENRVIGLSTADSDALLKSYPDEKMWETIGFLPHRIEEIVSDSRRVWFVQSWWEPENQIPLLYEMRAWLDAHAVRVDQREFDGVHVYLYEIAAPKQEDTLRYRRLTDGRDWIDGYSDAEPFSEEAFLARFQEEGMQLAGNRSVRFGFHPQAGVVASNDGDTSVEFEYSTRESIESIPGIAFDRNLEEDVWVPSSGYYSQTTMLAQVGPETRGVLQTAAMLPAGEMSVFLRVDAGGESETADSAGLRIEVIQGGRTLLDGVVERETEGWGWVKAGAVSSAGGETTIRITAQYQEGSDESSVDFERIDFVDPAGETSYIDPAVSTIEIPPGSVTRLSIDTEFSTPESVRRKDFEFQDEDENGYTLFYYR